MTGRLSGFGGRCTFPTLREVEEFPEWGHATTNYVEHPELVAQRLINFAGAVGRERVIASSDCGFGTFAGLATVAGDVTFAKLGDG